MPILADHFYVVAIIQDCGHFMPEEQPEEIGAKMVKFF
ncbi:alpha/beta hydrolase [Halomonas sp. 5021]|jgi:pimeloyl-ACP methyl ester carboxylesterase|nr:alpha/beta hydrolase [Halomonas sp. A40-4]QPL46938.1 alpha/beta hydrolase [Halomonas sp. A40-4]